MRITEQLTEREIARRLHRVYVEILSWPRKDGEEQGGGDGVGEDYQERQMADG